MDIRLLTLADAQDVKIPNQPFPLIGRMVVSRTQEKWDYTVEKFAKLSEQTFPDENYDFTELSRKGYLVGAYEADQCVALAIFQDDWLKYAFLYDLKVNQNYRGQGIAQNMIAFGLAEAKSRGYAGIWTMGQDNNLVACQFYLKCGFRIAAWLPMATIILRKRAKPIFIFTWISFHEKNLTWFAKTCMI